MPDLFGPWKPYSSLQLAEAADIQLPPVLVNRADMLLINVSLDDGKIPFDVLDELRLQHGVDVTGLQYSQTAAGNVYRAYALLR